MSELDELRNEAYDNAPIYKDRVKKFHDKRIVSKYLKPRMKVLLFNSRLKLYPRKLKSRWSGPFTITEVLQYGSVELINEATKEKFLVNGHQVKLYFERETFSQTVESTPISDPPLQ